MNINRNNYEEFFLMYVDGEYFMKDNIKALELFTKACGMNLKEACDAYDDLKGLVY